MKHPLTIGLLGLLLSLLAAPAVLAQAQAQARTKAQAPGFELLDRIVAVVNDGIVLQSELDYETGNVIRQLQAGNQPLPDAETLHSRVLERLILRTVQTQRARSLGIQIDDTALNRALEEIAANNRMSLAEFRQALLGQGFDYPRFREDIRTELLINQLRRREVSSRISITEQEIEDVLGDLRESTENKLERRLRQIFIAVPEGSTPERIAGIEQRARDLVARLRQGADFAALAARESDDEKALEGGDIGWRSNAQLPALFAEGVAPLAPGQVTDPLRSPIGFHILQLVDVRGEERYIVKQTLARHILLKVTPVRGEQQARAELEDLRRKLQNGADFGELARIHSEDGASASQGGELPWFGAGVMDPEFEDRVAALEPGEITAPFRSGFGWHLVELIDRREADNTDEFLRSRARQTIRKRKLEAEIETWLRRLRDEAYVELRAADQLGG